MIDDRVIAELRIAALIGTRRQTLSNAAYYALANCRHWSETLNANETDERVFFLIVAESLEKT